MELETKPFRNLSHNRVIRNEGVNTYGERSACSVLGERMGTLLLN